MNAVARHLHVDFHKNLGTFRDEKQSALGFRDVRYLQSDLALYAAIFSVYLVTPSLLFGKHVIGHLYRPQGFVSLYPS